jgi:hypothetical protein
MSVMTPLNRVAFERLAPVEKVVYSVAELQRQLETGGFLSYLLFPSGARAPVAVGALRAVGAHVVADLLTEACAVFPPGPVPKDREGRIAVLMKLRVSKGIDRLEALSREARAQRPSLRQRLHAYVHRGSGEQTQPVSAVA